MTTKQKAWQWCSKYIRLRDALDYCKRTKTDISQFSSIGNLPVNCCTCNKVISSWKYADAGHYFGRGLGGGSGAYFDERNINAQCKRCNGFKGGNIQVYDEFMLQRWGQGVIDELFILHHGGRKYQNGELIAMGQLYKDLYEELLKSI